MANKKTTKNKPTNPALRHAKHVFVPHAGNNYHPHLIRKHGLALLIALAFIGQFAYTFATTGQLGVLGRVNDVTISSLLDETNQARANAHLAPLNRNTKLDQAAYAKAQDMLAKNYWAHTSPEGVQPWKWLTDNDYNYDTAGENLAKNYPTATAVVHAWLESPAHRENVLNSTYQDVGFAVVDGTLDGKNTELVVALYGQPAATAVLASQNAAPAFQAAATTPQSPLGSFGATLQALNPAALGACVLLLVGIAVAMATYTYRKKLPKAVQRAWYAHHSLYKAGGLALLIFGVIALNTSGQLF